MKRLVKRTLIVLGILIVSGYLIYIFFWPYDYAIRFKAHTTAGTVYEMAHKWSENLPNIDSSEIFKREKESDKEFSFVRLKNDDKWDFRWKIQQQNDSLSKIEVRITDLYRSPTNRWILPFSSSPLKRQSKEMIKGFKNSLEQHLKVFKIKIEGLDSIPSFFCAYVSASGRLSAKAQEMIRNNAFITGFLQENDIKITGKPFVEVREWNQKTDSIWFDFCFPISKQDSLPEHDEIRFKHVIKRPAVLAKYYGNYRTSDRAWYALQIWAEDHGIQLQEAPFEIYYNNPFMGGNELEWKTEVFMPLSIEK